MSPQAGAGFLESLAATGPEPVDRPTAQVATRPDQSIRRLPDEWQPPPETAVAWTPKLPPHEREVEIEFNWAGAQARRTGTVLHQLLERVGNIGIENFDTAGRRSLIERIPNLLRALGTGPDTVES